MKIMLLLTADYANIEPINKKLNIIGSFDRIFAQSYPCTHHRMALVVKIRAELEDHHDERKLTIELVDEDGIKYVHITQPFQFPQPSTGLLGEHIDRFRT